MTIIDALNHTSVGNRALLSKKKAQNVVIIWGGGGTFCGLRRVPSVLKDDRTEAALLRNRSFGAFNLAKICIFVVVGHRRGWWCCFGGIFVRFWGKNLEGNRDGKGGGRGGRGKGRNS